MAKSEQAASVQAVVAGRPAESERAVVPKSLALLWGLEEPGGRGPKRGLTLARILDAAVEVADAEGYQALSMNRVARQLGFTAMSLYRYVDSKQTLIDLLLDWVIGEPPDIEPGATWREGLRQWAVAEYLAIERHPWWLEIPLIGPPMGPNNMAWLEAGLSRIAATEIAQPLRLQLVLNLSFYVIGRMRIARGMLTDSVDDDDFADVMSQLVDPARYPNVIAAFATEHPSEDEIDWHRADFEFGLDRLLDGYEHFIRTRR
ncbi:TetR/AcrR family transcriptional regulator [Nocardia bovistercoris]|uniref:TetR/AcrR family transcriptional regulator C-terminal domain-containing protein n=1 Tax=Nocardia bovistercoris TaxID=2785916 RepID=A0A931IAR2_9NOCA|nr:TetR/AcrR family transcriptional regulator [Nocardia bovistercoris]MBH0777028.1 TetR/AcrR family transcriptional regulator C-terminal domain-containing protein [Nocardia bovistercoris]